MERHPGDEGTGRRADESGPVPPTAASAVRSGVFRCMVFSLLFTAGSFTVLAITDELRKIEILPIALTLALSGMAVVPPTVLELAAKRWPATLRRDMLVALIGAVLGPLTFLAAVSQGVFSYVLARSRSYGRAADELLRFLKHVRMGGEIEIPTLALALGVLVAPVVVGRVRGWGVLRVVGLTLATALLVSAPTVAILMSRDRGIIFGLVFATAFALPLGAALGDWLERLARARWTGD